MNPVNVKVIKLNPLVDIPSYITEGASAVDLQASIEAPITLVPGEKSVLIPTGIKIFHGNPFVCSLIIPRSGLGHKKGLVLGNNVGLIDSDYQGELFVSAYIRMGHEEYTISPLERFAQLIFLPVNRVIFEEVSSFEEETNRGEGGFGSTGIKN